MEKKKKFNGDFCFYRGTKLNFMFSSSLQVLETINLILLNDIKIRNSYNICLNQIPKLNMKFSNILSSNNEKGKQI